VGEFWTKPIRLGAIMRCEKCKTNIASKHFQKINNGKKTEMYLCSDCFGDIELSMLIESLFKDLFSKAKLDFLEHIKKDEMSPNCKMRCSACDITFHEIKKDGNLGCAVCYESFVEPLTHAIDEAHGSHVHDGKYPRRGEAILKHENMRIKIELLMQHAVAEEDFERAAMFRDKLRLHDFLTTVMETDSEEDAE